MMRERTPRSLRSRLPLTRGRLNLFSEGGRGALTHHLELSKATTSTSTAQYTIQIEGGADQRKMCKSLREIAERLALWSGLLCIKSQMIGITQHAFKQESGLGKFLGNCLTCTSQRFDEPKRAHIEGSLFTRQPVNTRTRWITVHEAIAQETLTARALIDSVDGAQHPGIVRSHEKYQRHDEKRGVQIIASVRLSECATLFVPTASHDFFVDAIALADPLLAIRRQGTFVCEPLAAIQCYPIHHLRENEMVLSVAHLPNACVRTLPILANPIEAAPHSDPHVVRNRTDVFVVQIERVHELTVNIGLEL